MSIIFSSFLRYTFHDVYRYLLIFKQKKNDY